jgi:small subunit ribosomal protein S13
MLTILNRFVSKDIPLNKFLKKIFGLGAWRIKVLCKLIGSKPSISLFSIKSSQIKTMENFVYSNYVIASPLIRQVNGDIARRLKSGTFHGMRLLQKLPCRGQRTKTNAQTAKRRKLSVDIKKK